MMKNVRTFRRLLLALLSLGCLSFQPTIATAEKIQIDGPNGPLSGELVTAADAHDILVIIPGSGPTDRDGNSPVGLQTNAYKLLADDLKAAGVSSVRIDKRGLYGSSAAIPDPNNVTIGAYAEDARRWVERASKEAPCVWIAGHSEGGLVALAAAQDAPKNLCGLILMATSGRRVGQVLIEQLRSNLANAPLMPEIEAVVADMEAGRTRDPASLTPVLRPLFPKNVQNYMIDLFSYDPVVIAKNWQGRTLIIQGDADIQVKPVDADLLASAMPKAVRLDLPGATHVLKKDVAGNPLATYSNPVLPLHPELIPGIVRFLKQEPTSN